MEDAKYTEIAVRLQEVDSRTRSNARRLDDHGKELKELREKQDALYELTSSVKSIATDMAYIKEDVKDVKTGQDRLSEKVTELEARPLAEAKRRTDGIVDKLVWLLIGGLAAGLLAALLPGIPW